MRAYMSGGDATHGGRSKDEMVPMGTAKLESVCALDGGAGISTTRLRSVLVYSFFWLSPEPCRH